MWFFFEGFVSLLASLSKICFLAKLLLASSQSFSYSLTKVLFTETNDSQIYRKQKDKTLYGENNLLL